MPEETKKKIKIPQLITVKNFSEILNLPTSQVITELMKNGILANINERIDFETASIIAEDLGFETEEEKIEIDEREMTIENLIEICKKEKESGESLSSRPPVVTILGHVDHGKTTLLDTIRETSVASRESGGITQHISAYQVKKRGQLITFVDTPGHEAFATMRERGVSLADIAILVVAADDGVRPQTKEVIDYLLERKIPTIVAINKIDKPEANVQKVKQELSDNGVQIEEWGGEILSSEISAKQKIGIDNLLDNILLVNEVEDFKANFKRNALGIVLESHLDSQRGPIATILIKTGTLREGQDVKVGKVKGRVRKIEDFRGQKIEKATPSTPINLIGLEEVVNSHDILSVYQKKAGIGTKSEGKQSAAQSILDSKLDAQKMYKSIEDTKVKKLNIILKADVQGSLEAIEQILGEIKSKEVAVDYISVGVGNITESDIRLAHDSQAIIYGFNVEATPVAKRMAESNAVETENYKVIYELVDSIKARLSDMLDSETKRTDFGKMKVLAIFKTEKTEMIVGGKVTKGKLINESLIEVERENKIVGSGELANLQQNKVDTDEVKEGNECGITFKGEAKIKEGDTLICYKEEIIKKML